MALIAIASDKGAPGVTTAALALAAVWPRPVLLAECDPAGGDLVYRFPAVGGGHLDPRRGVLSLAVVARRGIQPHQVWEHVQKLHGGLDVLAGVTNAEQGAGLSLLWGPIGKVLASLPQADVIADCGRLGADGPLYDLLAEATAVVLVTKVHVADVIRLRDRAAAFAAAAQSRGRRNFGVGVVVVADHKKFRAALGEVQHVLGQANAPATVLGGIAHDTKGADLLSGEWGGNLDRTMLIKTARAVAQQLVHGLPPIGNPAAAGPSGVTAPSAPLPGARRSTGPQPAASRFTGPQPAFPSSGPPPPIPAPPIPAPPIPAPPIPASPIPASTSPQPAHASAGAPNGPADLAAVTFPAPTVSASAPRTTFNRVLSGRSGRHQADPAQTARGTAQAEAAPPAGSHADSPAVTQAAPRNGAQAAPFNGAHTGTQAGAPRNGTQAQPRAARHAYGAGRPDSGSGSFFSRAPMPPLAPAAPVASADADPAGPSDPEHPEDS
jgi:MinD-like ATPase involved in chromosome partitioning or flagellar assembly